MMYVQSAAFQPSDLSRDQQRLATFLEQWKAIRSQRGARYKLRLAIPLSGASQEEVSVICLDEIRQGVYLLEAAPLGCDPRIYHYIRLIHNNGAWWFDKVLAAIDTGGRTAYDRGRIIRECFV